MTYPKDNGSVVIAGVSLGRMVEVGDNVAVFTEATFPVSVKDPELKLSTYQARQLSDLLLRPDARDLGEQLRRAVEVLESPEFPQIPEEPK